MMMPPDAELEQLRTRYFDLMRRYVQVGALLPTDLETFDYDDEAVWVDVEMVLAELDRIQGQMDELRIQAAVEQSACERTDDVEYHKKLPMP